MVTATDRRRGGGRRDALLGLKRLVEENLDEIDAAEINTFPLDSTRPAS